MPTNLPPEYFEAERKFRAAESIPAKIQCLEELLSTIPKHKGTDHLRADLRRKLAKLKSEQHKSKNIGKHDSEYHIEKEGSGRIVLTGPTNVGKSSLLAAVTHATPKISDSPFTTWSPIPGMMEVDKIQLQLIDTPPLSQEIGKSELFDLMRTADLILLMVDIQAFPIAQFEESLAILEAHKIAPSHLRDNYPEDRTLFFIPMVLIVNKVDSDHQIEDVVAFSDLLEGKWPQISISTLNRKNLDQLGKICIEQLNLIRIYSKPPGEEPDTSQPYVLKKGATIADFAAKVHRDFLEHLKSARVWGKKVYDGQQVSRDYVLDDGDIVELHG
jgi:small GTP-binding protein